MTTSKRSRLKDAEERENLADKQPAYRWSGLAAEGSAYAQAQHFKFTAESVLFGSLFDAVFSDCPLRSSDVHILILSLQCHLRNFHNLTFGQSAAIAYNETQIIPHGLGHRNSLRGLVEDPGDRLPGYGMDCRYRLG